MMFVDTHLTYVIVVVYRSLHFGNPTFYSCWLDESLNRTLRDVCARVHRSHMEVRVFSLFAIQGHMQINKWLFGGAFEGELESC